MTDLDARTPSELDHDRVMALPGYKRWYEGRGDWQWRWERKRRAKADKMREKAEAKYRAELRRIAAWEDSGDAYAAWNVEDDRRYWKLRKA